MLCTNKERGITYRGRKDVNTLETLCIKQEGTKLAKQQNNANILLK